MLVKMSEAGKSVLFTHADRIPAVRRYMKAKLGNRFEEMFRSLEDNDLALEWCENRLLETILPARDVPAALGPGDYELLRNFRPAEIEIIASFLKRRVYQQTEAIIEIGDEAHEMFFLARGGVSVFVPMATGARRRLATFSAGMVFGEMAVIDRSPRSARI